MIDLLCLALALIGIGSGVAAMFEPGPMAFVYGGIFCIYAAVNIVGCRTAAREMLHEALRIRLADAVRRELERKIDVNPGKEIVL